jgi:hypothetical protein
VTLLKQGLTSLTSGATPPIGGSTESKDEEFVGRCLQRFSSFEEEDGNSLVKHL